VESWIDSYFDCLSKADTATDQSEALALKRLNFPKALYRYRSSDSLASLLQELRKGYVYLSDPAQFNDPYDSALSTSLVSFFTQALEPYGYGDPSTVSQAIESMDEAARKAFFFVFSLVIPMRYGGSSPDTQNQDIFSALRNLVRVSCFTTNPNSVVMWSHYVSQHTGICIEFNESSILSGAKFLGLVHPVRYAKQLFDLTQVFSPSTPDKDNAFAPVVAACHKSEEWSYENEWRLVALDPADKDRPQFPLGFKPSRIILGARIGQAEQEALEELAQKISVPVTKAQLARDRFEIEF
jgi:hypothetical protein